MSKFILNFFRTRPMSIGSYKLETSKIIEFEMKIRQLMYRGYIFELVGDEKLYQNQEIKDFIKYLKSLEIYM